MKKGERVGEWEKRDREIRRVGEERDSRRVEERGRVGECEKGRKRLGEWEKGR